jgi:hypothetical protein
MIDDNLMVVKAFSPEKDVLYEILDRETMRPVRQPIRSLDELQRLFPTQN